MSLTDSLFYIHHTLISHNPTEKELQVYSKVTFEDEKIKVIDLNMKVTTHRIILSTKKNDHAFLIEGQKIHEALISESGMLWKKQYFVKLRTQLGKVKFQLNNYKQAHVTITSMLKNQQWTKHHAHHQAPKSNMYSGMFNKVEKDKQRIAQNQQKVAQSFTSFQSLFGNLREIKELMKDMKSKTGQADGDDSQVNQILKDIGFVSVVSKDQAGSSYFKQLARDLYQICQGTLFKKFGGIVSLLDLFYFYNMKRQMELVSPEQLLKACEHFQKYGYKAQLVTYPNNIKVIESTSFNAQQDFQAHFRQFFNDVNKGYSAQEISRKKGIPLAIIEIKLRKAARRGVLAIDNRIQGVKYYKNLFLEL